MAINWMLALRAVPWGDVVQAAPQIVKGARRLFHGARRSETLSEEPPTAVGDGDGVGSRLRQLEIALRQLDQEQQQSAELIRSLAEQNAQLVAAVAILRARVRLLLALSVGLALTAFIVPVWYLSR